MVYCPNCGKGAEDGSRYCPGCGRPFDSRGEDSYSAGGGFNAGDAGEHWDTVNFDPRDLRDNRHLSILNYFGPFLLIPLLMRPYSQFIRFHANQGLVLLIASLIISAVSHIPLFGWLFGFVGGIYTCACVIIGIINCVSGTAKELPIIGGIRILS